MKKIKLVLFTLICFFLVSTKVNAASIDLIDMDIVLDEYGTAVVTETWDASVNEGTEGWHPYYNLGNSKISVLGASMDGVDYQVVDSWDEYANLSEKAYKAGTYAVNSKEIDVVFGISEYGKHTYQVVYQITNFVSNLNDYDMVYWQLFPYNFSAEPKNVTIKISGPYYYPDTLEVWGYGMKGAPCYVKDGAIYMTSDGRISKSKYLTILARFPKGTFNTTSVYDYDFSHYQEMANKGAEVYGKQSFLDKAIDVVIVVGSIAFYAGIFILVGVAITRDAEKRKLNYTFGEAGMTLPKTVNNFRDIPCGKDIYRAFWVADTYNLNKNKNDFIGAVLLKWIYDGNVYVQTKEKKKLFKTDKEDVIIFDHKPENACEKEQKLYNYMKDASGDGILEKDEFKKWCKNNYTKILGWTDDVLKYERDELIKEGKIKVVPIQKGLIFKYTVNTYSVSPLMKDEAFEMKGLKQFLNEFSQIDKKEPIEVKLWHEYLMYAQIFGISKKVIERFKDLYPEIVSDMEKYNFDYATFMFIHSISNTGVTAATAARSAAQSYSSGGGGFSSGGGGGGSFGGGGGGGGFR